MEFETPNGKAKRVTQVWRKKKKVLYGYVRAEKNICGWLARLLFVSIDFEDSHENWKLTGGHGSNWGTSGNYEI